MRRNNPFRSGVLSGTPMIITWLRIEGDQSLKRRKFKKGRS